MVDEAFDPSAECSYNFEQCKLFYEGFVSIFDKGYHKSTYINTWIPHSNYANGACKPFYVGTKNNEAWIFILVKALAKYFGSYHNLSLASLEEICNCIFGCEPFAINEEFCKHNKQRFPVKLDISSCQKNK